MAQVEIFAGIIIPSAWAERVQRELEEARREEETRAWLANPANWDDPNFSDIYKDVYGFRPRYCCGRGYWSY